MFSSNKNYLKVQYLYNNNKNYMYKEAINILKEQDLAEEAMEISVKKILKYIDKIDVNDNKTKLLVSLVCRNIAINLNNKKNNGSIFFEYDDKINYDNFDKIKINEESIHIVTNALRDMPEIPRDVLLLEKVHKYTIEEISDLLDIPVEEVNNRSLFARAIIKNRLLEN